MKSLWLLHELGLTFDVKSYGFGNDLRSPEYLGVHPLGRVPCLEINGVVLFESGAIAEYIGERSDRPDLFFGPEHPDRAAWLQWLHYSETMTAHLANLTQQFLALHDPEMRSPVVIKLERRRLEKAIGVVEQHLGGRDYMVGRGFSIVDIGIGYALYIARLFTPLDAFPKARSYLSRLMDRPAFQAALPASDDPHRFYAEEGYAL